MHLWYTYIGAQRHHYRVMPFITGSWEISFEFESRKDVVHIFNNLLRRQIGSRLPTVEYLCKKPEIVFDTFKGYENEDIALNTGMILKEMLRHEPLCKILLWSDQCVSSYLLLSSVTWLNTGSIHSPTTLKREHLEFHVMHLPITRYILRMHAVTCFSWICRQETLTRHKPMVAEYLEKNYDRVRMSVSSSVNARLIPNYSSSLPTPLSFFLPTMSRNVNL